jgi:KDO2-lipid IV(A) lauroyltransferase
MSDNLLYFSYRALRFALIVTPKFIARATAFCLARLAYYIDRKHTMIIHKNLEFFLGDKYDLAARKKIAKAVYYRFLIYLFDILGSRGLSLSQLQAIVSVENEAILLDAIKRDEKIILLTGHYGYWELVAQYLCAAYRPFVTIGQKLHNSPKLTAELKRYRERSGLEVIAKKGAMRSIARALKEGKIVGFLPDQSTQKGVKAALFGRDLTWLDSASRLARQFGAIVIPCFITTDDFKRYSLFFMEPLRPDFNADKERDIERMVALEALSLQKAIERNPEEYFWFHKRMKREIEGFYN